MAIKNLLHHLNLRSTRLLPKLTLTSKIILSVFTVISLSFLIKSTIAVSTTDSMDSTGSNAATTNTTTDIVTDSIETSELTIDTTNLQGYLDKQTAITKGNNQESWINESLTSNVVSINQAIGGTLSKDSISKLSWVPGGMIGFTNNAIASLYQPSISGVQYIAQSVDSFLGKPAYAQTGFGFNKLNAILGMWKVSRNAVYTLISLFFIVVGIMIILRVKINPQTTVTIQSAIPSIISTLILVTFSYAIAGLIIDICNISQGILLSLINQGLDGGTKSIIDKTVSQLMKLQFWEAWSIAFTEFGWNGATVVATSVAGLVGAVVGGVAATFTGGVGAIVGLITGALTFGLIWLIIAIFSLIQVFKLFIGLAKCYVTAIIHIVIGPFEIGMGAIPGSKLGFSSWFTNVLANIAAFPATVIFLVFASFLIRTLQPGNVNLWSAPIMGSGWIVSAIVGIACLAMLSKIPQLVPEMLFKLKPSPYNKAIGEGLKTIPGVGLAVSGFKTGTQFGSHKAGGYIEDLGYDHDPITGERTSIIPGKKAKIRRGLGSFISFAAGSKRK